MKIPFLQKKSVGIHITYRAIRWVELSRIRNGLSLDCVETSTVKEGNIAECLNQIVDKANPSFPYVISNLDGSEVHQEIIEVPFQEDDYLNEWVEETPKEIIPEGSEIDEFQVAHHIIGDKDERRSCLFVMAPKEAVASRVELLESVGLQPIALTTGDFEAGYGLLFDSDFINEDPMLLKAFEDRACLLSYEDGLVCDFFPLPVVNDVEDLLSEVESLVVSRPNYKESKSSQLLYTALSKNLKNAGNNKVRLKIRELHPLPDLNLKGKRLSMDESIACGMAVKQLYPALDRINLLDEENVRLNADEVEKKDAFLTTGVLVGFILLAFFCLNLLEWNMERRKSDLDKQVAQVQDKITSVTDARQRVQNLKSTISDVRRLVAERTSMVKDLESISRSIPNRIWLDVLQLTNESKKPRVILKGYAKDESRVSLLLRRLERLKEVNNVRLLYSKQLKTSAIYDKKYQEDLITSYKVQLKTTQGSE